MTEKVRSISKNLIDNNNFLNEELAIDKNFDVVQVDVEYAERKMSLFLIDGLVKDEILSFIMRELSRLTKDDLAKDPLDKLLKKYIPYVEIEKVSNLKDVIDGILAGPAAILIDGCDYAILIDARTYPARGPEEPDIERVVRGSRDGFVETLVFNTALIRRRVRDATLRMEYLQVGRRSKTDIIVCYIADIADEKLVANIKESLSAIDTDGIPMAEKTIEEYVAGRHWNPYPLVRYTERPDTTASHLYEGHVCIIVDGSPSVIIAPTTYWHHLQHAEEYRNKPFVGAYLRFVRFLAVWSSIFLLPLWYLFVIEPDFLPEQLSFIGPNEVGKIPIFLQFIIVEVGIDMLRMAAIHTPSSLATALGLVAALMIGEVAVQVGLLSNEVILYLAIAAIGTFATPSYEMSLANRLFRIILLIATATFKLFGFVIVLTLTILLLLNMKSFGTPYLWPLIPFDYKAMSNVFIRTPMPLKKSRPRVLHPRDGDR